MSRPSTRNLALPEPQVLESLCQSLAVLDAIIEREWHYRYFSFDKYWSRDTGNRMGSMRNGCGDDYHILFTAAGVALKGYAHEYPLARRGARPAGMFEGFPTAIEGFLSEPAFQMEDTTFCMWCPKGGAWSIGRVEFPEEHADPDGSEFLLELLTGAPEDYLQYARGYYEKEVPLEIIKSIYAHEPLTEAMVRALNPKTSLGDLAEDLTAIGYPVVTS